MDAIEEAVRAILMRSVGEALDVEIEYGIRQVERAVDTNGAELAALKSTAEDLECLLGEAQKALVNLTPGGSEYVGDPARCVAFVRRKEEGLERAMKRFKDRADKAQVENKRLREAMKKCLTIAETYGGFDGTEIVAEQIRALIKQLGEDK